MAYSRASRFRAGRCGREARRRRLSAELARVFHLARGCAISDTGRYRPHSGLRVSVLAIVGITIIVSEKRFKTIATSDKSEYYIHGSQLGTVLDQVDTEKHLLLGLLFCTAPAR